MTIQSREQDLLGWMMARGELPEHVASLKPEWFSDRLNGYIFGIVCDLAAAGDFTDPSTVTDKLNAAHPANENEQDRRREYVWDLVNNAAVCNHKYFAKCIAEHGKRVEMRNALLMAANEMMEHDSYEDALSAALGHVDSRATDGMERGLLTIADIAKIGLDFIESRIDNKFQGLKTGFDDLDDLIFGGFRHSELITIFGPPKGGKTTAVTTIVENIALSKIDDKNYPVILIASREMGESQLAVRHYASLGGASARNVLTGNMRDEDWNSVSAAVGRMADMNIIYDLDSNTPSQIAMKAAQVKRSRGRLDMIVVDHIGLVTSDRQRRSRIEEVTDITWSLKTLAKRMAVPVVMIAQQNRKYADRKDRTPNMADLAESSSIEKDSDLLIGVLAHREGDLRGFTEIHVIGARLGEIGMVPAKFHNNRLIPCSAAEFEMARSRAGMEEPASGKGLR